ncbi:MAG: hypothetical protein Q8P34_07235 [Bacteroidota bacterium]|nr:hypothetical protein [Bacteroidota bacterium]
MARAKKFGAFGGVFTPSILTFIIARVRQLMAEIHVHLLSPEMAIKTEESLRVFVGEVFE